jgi:long-chain fatty acid transport protein
MRKLAILVPAAAVLALALAPASALASGFQLVEQNGSGLGNAFAGQAAGVSDASAIFFNPAALTRIPKRQLVLSIEPIGLGTTFTNSGSGSPTLPSSPPLTLPVPLGSDGGDAGGWIPVPNGYFSLQVGSQVWLGVAVNVPFGLETSWEGDWVGRFHAVKSKIETININPTVAVKLTDALSIGGGVSYQRLSATLSQNAPYGASVGAASMVPPAFQQIAFGAILQQLGGPAGLAREGLSTVEGDSWAWGWNAGVMLQVGEQGRLGASYRSAITHDIDGTVTFQDAPTFQPVPPLADLFNGLNARFANGPVTAKVKLPDTLSVAAAFEGEKVEVLADWTWTGWSSIQSLDVLRTDGADLSSVPLLFEDTWRAGLGVNVKLNDRFKLRLGTAYDKTPVQDQYRTPRLPDGDRVWAAGGFECKLGEQSAIDVGYAHLFIGDISSDLPNQSSPSATPQGALVGTYTADVNIFSAQLRVGF